MKTATAALIVTFALGPLAAPLAAAAQHQSGKVARIGLLPGAILSDSLIAGLKHGLRELAYIEGQNVLVEYAHTA